MNRKSLLKIQKQAERWTMGAGRILQEYQSKAKIKKRKADFLDITTDADLESKCFLIKQIHKHFPEHSILSEEAGGKVTDIYGKPIKNRDLSKGIVVSNGKIHKELLGYLKSD